MTARRQQLSLASGESSCGIDGYNEAPSCSSFASGSFDIDVIFHVHCTKPVWCVTSDRSGPGCGKHAGPVHTRMDARWD